MSDFMVPYLKGDVRILILVGFGGCPSDCPSVTRLSHNCAILTVDIFTDDVFLPL